MKLTKRLSRKEAHRLALHYAICERDSLSEAYSERDDPAAVRARWLAAEFRRVLRDEFGQITLEDDLAANPGPGVPIQELAAGRQALDERGRGG